jgi:hypothetical protein
MRGLSGHEHSRRKPIPSLAINTGCFSRLTAGKEAVDWLNGSNCDIEM